MTANGSMHLMWFPDATWAVAVARTRCWVMPISGPNNVGIGAPSVAPPRYARSGAFRNTSARTHPGSLPHGGMLATSQEAPHVPAGPENVMRTFAVEFVAPKMALAFVHWLADLAASVSEPPSRISATAP